MDQSATNTSNIDLTPNSSSVPASSAASSFDFCAEGQPADASSPARLEFCWTSLVAPSVARVAPAHRFPIACTGCSLALWDDWKDELCHNCLLYERHHGPSSIRHAPTIDPKQVGEVCSTLNEGSGAQLPDAMTTKSEPFPPLWPCPNDAVPQTHHGASNRRLALEGIPQDLAHYVSQLENKLAVAHGVISHLQAQLSNRNQAAKQTHDVLPCATPCSSGLDTEPSRDHGSAADQGIGPQKSAYEEERTAEPATGKLASDTPACPPLAIDTV